jgi:hypothetical protein
LKDWQTFELEFSKTSVSDWLSEWVTGPDLERLAPLKTFCTEEHPGQFSIKGLMVIPTYWTRHLLQIIKYKIYLDCEPIPHYGFTACECAGESPACPGKVSHFLPLTVCVCLYDPGVFCSSLNVEQTIICLRLADRLYTTDGGYISIGFLCSINVISS